MSISQSTDALIRPMFLDNSELHEVYKTSLPSLIQKVYPSRRRIDTLSPSNPSTNSESYLYQSGMNYLKMKLRTIGQLNVTIAVSQVSEGVAGNADNTVNPTGDYIVYNPGSSAFPPTVLGLLNQYNLKLDTAFISKAVRNVQIRYGQTMLYSTWGSVSQREPILQELKTLFVPKQRMENMNLVQGLSSGYPAYDTIASGGLIARVLQVKMTPECVLNTQLYTFSNEISNCLSSDKLWVNSVASMPSFSNGTGNDLTLQNLSLPWKLVGTPTARNETDNVPAKAMYTNGEWIVVDNADILIKNKVVSINFNIEYDDEIMEPYLDTKLQSDDCGVVEIAPNNYVTIDLEYNNDYIQWGAIKYITSSVSNSTGSIPSAPTNQPANSIQSYVSVSRVPSASRLVLESFDVYKAPSASSSGFKKITFEPKRIQSAGSSFKTTPITSSVDFTFIDQDSNKISPYYLFSADLNLMSDPTNRSTLQTYKSIYNLPTFNWCSVSKPFFYINQVNILENIPLEKMVEDTLDILKNPSLNRWFKGLENFNFQDAAGIFGPVINDNSGIPGRTQVPFLIINPDRYTTLDGSKLLSSNVLQASIVTTRGGYTATPPQHLGVGLQNVNVYANIFKFDPYLYYQVSPRDAIQKTEVKISADAWASFLKETARVYDKTYDLDKIYGGGFDLAGIANMVKKYGPTVLRFLMTGIRHLEQTLPKGSMGQTAAKTASDVARVFAYGK